MLFAVLALGVAPWRRNGRPQARAGAAALAWMLPGVGVIDPRTFETAASFGTFFHAAGFLRRPV